MVADILTASQVLEELLDDLHMAGDLLASHLLNAVIAVINAEDFLASKDGNAENKNVLANQHVAAVKLAAHGELASAHMGHE